MIRAPEFSRKVKQQCVNSMKQTMSRKNLMLMLSHGMLTLQYYTVTQIQ